MKLAIIPLLILCVLCVGCSPGNVLTSLNVAVATSDALVISLSASGSMDPATAALIVSTIAPLPGTAQYIVAELSSTDSDILRAQKITEKLKPILATFDALPPKARIFVAATLAAWNAFLAAFPVPSPGTLQASRHSTVLDSKKLDAIRGQVFELTDHAGEMRR